MASVEKTGFDADHEHGVDTAVKRAIFHAPEPGSNTGLDPGIKTVPETVVLTFVEPVETRRKSRFKSPKKGRSTTDS